MSQKTQLNLAKYINTYTYTHKHTQLPGSSDGKESACSAGDLGLIPGSGRSLEEGNGNPLQYSCLESSMGAGAQQAIVHVVTKSWTLLRNFHFYTYIGIS